MNANAVVSKQCKFEFKVNYFAIGAEALNLGAKISRLFNNYQII